MDTRFDDLRPYYNTEVPAAMQRMADSEYILPFIEFVFPDRPIKDTIEMIRNIKTIDEFQRSVMKPALMRVINSSMDSFNFEGLDYLKKNKNYLFISNHRDIAVDSSLLQYVFYLHDYKTTEISFGSNLMKLPFIIDLGKCNKMYRVERGGSIRDFYRNSQHLSDYIRYTICENNESVWIAQRNGRTKNGFDATEPGIIKMFSMSYPQDEVKSLCDLNIVPVSISYQWEPCDLFKVRELFISRRQKYIKGELEDLTSIITGIMQPKGNVYLSICKPLEAEEIEKAYHNNPANFHKQVAQLIDQRIYQHYSLFDTNYVAADLLKGNDLYKDRYTIKIKEQFIRQCNKLHELDLEPFDELKNLFYTIYANPVFTKENMQ